jgi:hypothetical protein
MPNQAALPPLPSTEDEEAQPRSPFLASLVRELETPPEPVEDPRREAARSRLDVMEVESEQQWEGIEASRKAEERRPFLPSEMVKAPVEDIRNFGKGVVRAVENVGSQLGGAMQAGGAALQEPEVPPDARSFWQGVAGTLPIAPDQREPEPMQPASPAVAAVGQRLRDLGKEGERKIGPQDRHFAAREPGYIPDDFWEGMKTDPARTLAINGVENIGSLAAMLGASAVGGPAAGIATAGALTGGGVFNEAKERNATDAEALQAVGYTIVPSVVLEYFPVGRAIARMAKGVPEGEVVRVVQSAIKSAAEEGVTESMQRVVEILGARAAYAEERGWGWKEGKDVLMNGIIGAITGGPVGGVMGARSAAQPQATPEVETETAQGDRQPLNVTEINLTPEQAAESAASKVSPEVITLVSKKTDPRWGHDTLLFETPSGPVQVVAELKKGDIIEVDWFGEPQASSEMYGGKGSPVKPVGAAAARRIMEAVVNEYPAAKRIRFERITGTRGRLDKADRMVEKAIPGRSVSAPVDAMSHADPGASRYAGLVEVVEPTPPPAAALSPSQEGGGVVEMPLPGPRQMREEVSPLPGQPLPQAEEVAPPSRAQERTGSGLAPEAIQSWIERLGTGKPGLSYGKTDGATNVAYRDKEGKVVAGAVLNADDTATDLLFSDKTRGLLASRAAVAVMRDLTRRNVAVSEGEVSSDAIRARLRMESAERKATGDAAVRPAPETTLPAEGDGVASPVATAQAEAGQPAGEAPRLPRTIDSSPASAEDTTSAQPESTPVPAPPVEAPATAQEAPAQQRAAPQAKPIPPEQAEAPTAAKPEPSVVERLPAARAAEAGYVRVPGENLIRDIKIAVDRQIKPQGNLPVSAWKLKLQKDHNLAAHMKGMEYRLRKLNQKIRAYKGPLTKKQLTRYLGDALRGNVPIDLRAETSSFDQKQIARIAERRGIPEAEVAREFARTGEVRPGARNLRLAPNLAATVGKLRMDIDAVTRALRREGLLDDAAARDLERSGGLYVHRSFDAFRGDAKSHLRKVEASPLWNRAKELITQEHPDFTENEIEGVMREFVERGDKPTLPGNVPEGALNRSVLFQRTNARDLERLLLGERRDIRSQALDTLIGQVSLLEHHRFLKALREDGLGKYLYERPTDRHYRNIAESPTPLAVLDPEGQPKQIYRKATLGSYGEMTASGKPGGKALHTTPEILRELEDAMPHPSEWPLWLKMYSLGNFAVKTNLTVLSPTTTSRNYLSNSIAALANGYGPWSKTDTGARAAASVVLRDIANSSSDKLRATYQRFIRLGLMDQGADYGDLRRLGAFADLMRVEEDTGARPLTATKGALNKAGQVYQHGDNYWKIYAWGIERARLEKAHPEWADQRPKSALLKDDASISRLDEEAAAIPKRVLQNYSELPRLARSISVNPVVAPFFSFTWAMFRNVKETSLQAAREVQSKNPETKKVGYQRAAGIITALALPEMLTFAARWAFNTDDEDEEALREFVYPWDRGSSLMIVNKKPGEMTYFNWGFMDYFSKLKEPVRLTMEAATSDRDASDVASDLFADYGEEVLLGSLIDATRGETADGYRVWLEKDSFRDRAGKGVAHLWRTGRPGVARNIGNLNDAVRGQANRNLLVEIVALAGPRFTVVNFRDRLDRYGAGFSRNLGEATRLYSQFANRSQDPGAEAILRGYRRANEERQELLADAKKKIEAGVVSGLSTDEVEKILVDSGLYKKYYNMAVGDTFEPVDYKKGKHWKTYEDDLKKIHLEFEKR